MQNKKCTKCKELKLISEFTKRKASKDGYRAMCKCCVRTKLVHKQKTQPDFIRGKNLKARFNLSINDYNKLFLKQRGVCAICKNPEVIKDVKGEVKWLSVDHNHDTGDIRGLLCNACNTGLGKLGDSVDILKNAIKYLNERGTYGK